MMAAISVVENDSSVSSAVYLRMLWADEADNIARHVVALTRAVVKNSRVILLDEATSSVDPETDASIQRTIRNEFTSQTLLCIAHRLATIVSTT